MRDGGVGEKQSLTKPSPPRVRCAGSPQASLGVRRLDAALKCLAPGVYPALNPLFQRYRNVQENPHPPLRGPPSPKVEGYFLRILALSPWERVARSEG
jgi:hypothetical protein